jgi:hypothetical protein
MFLISNIVSLFTPYVNVIRLLVIVLITFIIFLVILKSIKHRLLKNVKRKQQKSNVFIFLDLLKYIFTFFSSTHCFFCLLYPMGRGTWIHRRTSHCSTWLDIAKTNKWCSGLVDYCYKKTFLHWG